MALSHSPRIVTEGMVLNLDAANVKSYPGSGTNWYDLSGKGNHGAMQGGMTYSDGSMNFPGTSAYATLPNNGSLDILDVISIEAWVNLAAIPGAGVTYTVYGAGYNGTYEQTFLRFANSRIQCGTYWNSDANALSQYDITSIASTGVWYHVVGGYNGANWVIYWNGALLHTGAITPIYNSDSPCSVGGAWINGSYQRYFNGKLPIVRVYNRALSIQEIKQNYEALRGRFGV